MIAVDDSLILYSLRYAMSIEDSEAINYICNRIAEVVPEMQLKTVVMLIDAINYPIEHTNEARHWSYLKESPLLMLRQLLRNKRKEYKQS